MITLAQRIEQLRTQKGLSRPALSGALGLPKNAVEKFETGRQTPTQEQQGKMAAFFGVSLAYLRGESSDPTRQDSWMDAVYDQEQEEPAPVPRQAPKAARPAAGQGQASVLDAFIRNGEFQQLLRDTVLEVLRSPQGQEILSRTVRRELDRQK
jgi:transcriptional regulator with XRE-family HTH domain